MFERSVKDFINKMKICDSRFNSDEIYYLLIQDRNKMSMIEELLEKIQNAYLKLNSIPKIYSEDSSRVIDLNENPLGYQENNLYNIPEFSGCTIQEILLNSNFFSKLVKIAKYWENKEFPWYL